MEIGKVRRTGFAIGNANQVERLELAVARCSLGCVQLVDMFAEDRLRARSGGGSSGGRNIGDYLGYFPLVLFANSEWRNGITFQKTYLNTIEILELESGGGVQEAKVDAVGVPSFVEDIIR